MQKDYNISKDPEHRGIGGASSGAIAAFMVAWERPDEFRKVISIVGSFVNLRGGHVYPERVAGRATKKPIRVFFQDGRNDNRGARQGRQLRPEARLVPTERPTRRSDDEERLRRQLRLGHRPARPKQGGAILPDMMRWLWRDHPVSTDVKDSVERSYQGPAVKEDKEGK